MGIQQKFKNLIGKSFWSGLWYAMREVLLIVVGVLLAVWIDNLNDNQKDRTLEIKTLRALKIGLQQDSSDIYNNIKGLGEITRWRKKMTLLSEGKIPIDSLKGEMPISNYIFFLNNIAPYENLKSVGLSKISNDTLRNQIITLFELEYKILTNYENKVNAYKAEKLDYYMELRTYHFHQKKPELDFISILLKDKNFSFINFNVTQKELIKMQLYINLQLKLNHLIRNVKKECERK